MSFEATNRTLPEKHGAVRPECELKIVSKSQAVETLQA